MLFNSIEFIFLFLPITLVAYEAAMRFRERPSSGRLVLNIASIAFIARGGLYDAGLMVASIVLNFLFHRILERQQTDSSRTRWMLGIVAANVAFLGFFKYAGFVVETLNAVLGAQVPIPEISLPLAISFYTFQMIALTIDMRRERLPLPGFSSYALFITVFPHLIAGPIVRFQEYQGGFAGLRRLQLSNVLLAAQLFSVGLFKKAVMGDSLGAHAARFHEAVTAGASPHLLEAWGGSLAYTFQIYFDFSGYSDMAIALAALFGIRLPMNFFSPYRATSIIEFWRRWHISLSRFLRDYLYVSLGGNRRGPARRWVNLVVTMLLGGLWHGPAWTFVVWGAYHGALLALNHMWRSLGLRLPLVLSWALTFVAVTVGWVLFRAESMDAAWRIYAGMLGLNGIVLPERLAGVASLWGLAARSSEMVRLPAFLLVALGGVICLALPNSEQLFRGGGASRPAFRMKLLATGTGVAGALGLLSILEPLPFIYFRF